MPRDTIEEIQENDKESSRRACIVVIFLLCSSIFIYFFILVLSQQHMFEYSHMQHTTAAVKINCTHYCKFRKINS